MESKEVTAIEKETQTIQLVKGEFTLEEASAVIMSLINAKIDFHKLKRLQIWESDHNCETAPFTERIAELEKEREAVSAFIKKTNGSGQNLKINGTLEISLA